MHLIAVHRHKIPLKTYRYLLLFQTKKSAQILLIKEMKKLLQLNNHYN